jgi:hypothetical protein
VAEGHVVIPEVDGTYVARMEGECREYCVRAIRG